MPPKPKAGKKDGAAKLADKENLARAEAEVLGLQRILELRSFEGRRSKSRQLMLQAVEARRSERLWRERMDAFSGALEQQKEDTLDITADMLRQYKAMQEQLLKKLSDVEVENAALRKGMSDKQVEIDQLKAEIVSVNEARDAEVLQCQQRIEEMQMDFTHMLKDTLDKMRDRLAQGHAA